MRIVIHDIRGVCGALVLSAALVACGNKGDAGSSADASISGPDAGVSDCEQDLDAETLQALVISIESTLSMRPGESRTLSIGTVECCYVIEPVDACVSWSVDSPQIATIDSETGRLSILDSAQHGDAVSVKAHVGDGRFPISVTVHIYTETANPLRGVWTESRQLGCDGGAEITPERVIGEVRFDADGVIRVTWTPFEIYYDYWGHYSYNVESGAFGFAVDGGNYVPSDVPSDADSAGTFEIDNDGQLILRDVWLGKPQQGGPTHCGHILTR